MKSEESSKTNLNDLIRKIKSEGIEEAEKKSEEIVKEARLAASEILNKAGLDAASITEKAEESIRKKESISKMALEQAARDIILSIRTSLTEIFNSLIKKEYQNVLSGETLENVLVKLIEGWQKNEMGDTEKGLRSRLVDISEDGAAMLIGGRAKVGLPIKVQFLLNDLPVVMCGVVKGVNFDEKRKRSTLHLQAVPLSPVLRNRVLTYVYNLFGEREVKNKRNMQSMRK